MRLHMKLTLIGQAVWEEKMFDSVDDDDDDEEEDDNDNEEEDDDGACVYYKLSMWAWQLMWAKKNCQ